MNELFEKLNRKQLEAFAFYTAMDIDQLAGLTDQQVRLLIMAHCMTNALETELRAALMGKHIPGLNEYGHSAEDGLQAFEEERRNRNESKSDRP